MTISLSGLSQSEVLARRAKGLGNNVPLQSSRTYTAILRQNLLTFTNIVLFSIGIALVLLHLYSDAILSVGLVLLNVIVSVIQEARAKRTLDQIALLTRPKATVIRDGHESIIDPNEIVVGDVLVAAIGDQIVVDGEIIGDGRLDADESLLTGESDLVPKRAGDTVYSGSFVVTGRALYEAKKVGAESFANRLTAGARAFRQMKTPLQMDIDLAIRVLVLLAVQLGILLGLSAVLDRAELSESAKVAAVVGGLIPNGLIFMVTLAYGMGAVRMAGTGALIQQFNAVESMSNVNVLCLDKTGTLTANKINLNAVRPLNIDETRLKGILADTALNTSAGNRTSAAIVEALGGQPRKKIDEVPFSSARKWSAISFDDPAIRGVYALGAPEMLQPYLVPDSDAELRAQIAEWSNHGLRVLIIAYCPDVLPLHNGDGEPNLPNRLTPLGAVSFSDELRDEAFDTLRRFAETGIALKIISGDNPNTVAALARQAGLSGDIEVVSGLDLAKMDDAQVAQVAEKATVFGRITPDQKERLVQALRSRGHYVAMVGDGVNDVLSLKKAHIGIAMQSGSQAARSVADIVLLNDSFAALPPAFREGQRILSGMQDIIRLFLTRALYVAILILGAAVVGVGFPFAPKQVSILTLLTVGVPTIALAAWAKPTQPPKRIIRSVMHFIIPAAITLALVSLVVYALYYIQIYEAAIPPLNTVAEIQAFEARIGMPAAEAIIIATDEASSTARTVLTTLTVLCGLLLIVFVEPPTQFWVGGDALSGDWRPSVLAAALLVIFITITLVPGMRRFFELRLLNPSDYVLIVTVAIGWGFAVRWFWRSHFFDRFIGLESPD